MNIRKAYRAWQAPAGTTRGVDGACSFARARAVEYLTAGYRRGRWRVLFLRYAPAMLALYSCFRHTRLHCAPARAAPLCLMRYGYGLRGRNQPEGDGAAGDSREIAVRRPLVTARHANFNIFRWMWVRHNTGWHVTISVALLASAGGCAFSPQPLLHIIPSVPRAWARPS